MGLSPRAPQQHVETAAMALNDLVFGDPSPNPHRRKLKGLPPRGSGVRTSPAAVPANAVPSRIVAPSPYPLPRGRGEGGLC